MHQGENGRGMILMINDRNEIREKTGLEVGKVFLFDEIEDGTKELYDDNSNKPILYDDSLGNFHMLPKSEEKKQKISNINNKMKSICEELKNKLKEYQYPYQVKMQRGRSNALNETGMIDAFNYIRAINISNCEKKYDMMFSRFYINNNEEVNCIIGSYQFAYSNKSDYSYLVYPKSKEGKEHFSVSLEREYYNPITKYDCNNDINDIVNEFLEYIKAHEK